MDFQGKEDHCCGLCDFTFAKKSQLESHMRSHTQENPFVCDQCNRRYSHKSALRHHIRTVHEGIKTIFHANKYECFICPYVTHNKHIWEAHTQAHLRERGFPCQHPYCEYAATSSNSLKSHNYSKHKKERRFLCQFPNCGYQGKTRKDLRQHEVTHSEKRPFVCEFDGCSYRSKWKGHVQQHKRNVHNGGYKPFTCTACNYCTTTKSRLTNHQLKHSKEKLVKCDWSGCCFSSKTNKGLTLHVLNRHTAKMFKCDIQGCQSSFFASLSRLKSHKKKVHDKAYKCPNCNYRTAVPSELQTHILCRHISRKWIPCPTRGCTFQAKHPWTLTRHMRLHKANLVCTLKGCGYVAHSSSTLKRHMKLHDSTGRPFSCPLCCKRFPTNVVLSQHLRAHTQEKPFQCPVCSFGAVNRSNVIRHVGTFHPNVSCKFTQDSICDHCSVNFGCALGLAIHRTKLKTAVVVLTRLQLEM